MRARGVADGRRRRVALTSADRRPLLALAAVALAVAGAIAPVGAGSVRAAGDGLSLSTKATYTIDPARHLVRVVVDVTARNNKPDTVSGSITTRYFYDAFRLAIQPEARSAAASVSGRALGTTTKPVEGYRVLEVQFAHSLYFNQATTVRVTFNLPGGDPRSDSEIRVGSAFATFVAWAFGDVGSVRIVVPAGYEVETTGSDVARGKIGAETLFTASGIADIASWSVTVTADRKSALTSARIDLADGEHMVIHAWPEDHLWTSEVTNLLTDGLPELVSATGLPWPVSGDLAVFEVHTPLLQGYGGVFFEGQNRIEISEDLDELTILHEASHAWFNGQLFDGRWINEGFADTYAEHALDAIGDGGWAPDRVAPTDKAAIRLNSWFRPGRITDHETDAREQYGYNASWTVIRTIRTEIGDDRMRQVITAAQDHLIAYVGAGAAETIDGVADWRRLLDLLDERGGSKAADDLFRRFVTTDDEAKVLDERAAARSAYAALVQAEGDWSAPLYVRESLSDWHFSDATTRIQAANAVLALRARIADLAASIGLPAPTNLRTVYQLATTTLDGAATLADGELAAGQDIRAAGDAVAAPRDPLVTIGLVGSAPEADLAVARSEFSAGSPTAAADAIAVSALMAGAGEIGRERLILAAIIVAMGVVILLVLVTVLVRRRRRARRVALAAATSASLAAFTTSPAAAGIGPDAGWDPEAPYATLADQSAGQPAADALPTSGEPPDIGSSEGPAARSPDPIADPPSQTPTDRGAAS